MKDRYKSSKDKGSNKLYKKKIKKILMRNKSEMTQGSARHYKINSSKLSDAPTYNKYQPSVNDEEDNDVLPEWDDLTNKDKLKLFSTWSLVSIFSYLCLILGSFFMILNTQSVSQQGEIILGFGTFLTWLSLIKFYQNSKGYNVVLNTIENSFEIVWKSLAGIMPIFIGYGLLGTAIFWRSHRFADFSTSMFSLFAVMNGDMIFDTWHDIDTVDYLLAQVYLYTFIFFSIAVILNTFIVIIEDGYIMQKFFARTDWVKGVNQRSSLHTAEKMMENKNEEGLIERQSSFQKQGSVNSRGNTVYSKGSNPKKSAKLQIPLMHGAPIPHDGDPFIRIIKKTKKDYRSRKALIKMLRHEKVEIIYERQQRKLSKSQQRVTRLDDLEEDNHEESKDILMSGLVENEFQTQENIKTPEAIARKINELMMRFNDLKQEELDKCRGTNDEEEQIQDVEQRFAINFERIEKCLGAKNS